MAVAAWLALHGIIGALGTWWARRYALRASLIDHPGERRSHTAATPRGGGVAIVAAMLTAAGVGIATEPGQAVLPAAFALGLALVAGIGAVDDHRPLSPWLRLGVHAIAAAALAGGFYAAYGDPWLALAAFVLSIGLTNVWNFMDGIDGLAASQAALFAGAAAVWLQGPAQWLALALCAACCGFLPFNFPRARIFLGDVGSGALGYAIAALCVAVAAEASPGWPLSLLPLAAFLVDAALTLVGRMLRGERWWTPHVTHAYQIWARRVGHVPVTWGYGLWTATAVALWWLFRAENAVFITMVLLSWYTLSGLAWRSLRRESGFAVVGDRISKDKE